MKIFRTLFFVLMASTLLVACGDFDDGYGYDDYGYTDDFEEDAFFEEEETAVDELEANEGASGADFSEGGDAGAFVATECPFSVSGGADIECGRFSVPESRETAVSPTISLAVAIVRAPNDAGNPPLVYLAGGPGGSALDDYAFDPASWEYPFLRDRDLILVDQRGAGYSEPTLDCPEFATAGERENPDALCYDRLTAAGINLAAYNTTENAADLVDLRKALGISQWDLLGISYGTRLALEMMRQDPDGIGAVILDSPFPPNADTPLEEIYSLTDALGELYADCARDAYCDENYPDLEAVFLDTVQQLNADESAQIFGDDLVFAVNGAFADTELIPLIPYVIYEVANGNFAALDEISTGDGFKRPSQDDVDRSDSEGMYNSVICHDEFATTDYERVENAIDGTIPVELEGALLQNTFDLTQLCSYWNPMTQVDNTAVSSPIPTLILVGQYDTATPPRWGALTAATLPQSFLVQVPGAGHSLLSSVDCAVDIAEQFLNAPQQAPDTGCLQAIEWPYFE